MKNPWCEGKQTELDGSLIIKVTSYLYFGRLVNMENNVMEELERDHHGPHSGH